MSDSNSQPERRKKYFSDIERKSDYLEYINKHRKELTNKIQNLPHPKDYPFSMSDGRLFQKFATEYIKNILLKNHFSKCSENIPFNFFEYVQIFTESEHTETQKKLFQDIIAFKNSKAQSQDYMFSGDFDMIINSISGQNIMEAINEFTYNIYLYPGNTIERNVNYCIIGEIKKDFFEEIKKIEVIKQFTKYQKILELLSSEPNLNKLKKRIGLSENNKFIFFMVTDGNYNNFDYMIHMKKSYQEDIHSDKDSDKLPKYLKVFNSLNSVVPVVLIFVPRTLDDNKGIYVSQREKNTFSRFTKEIETLKENQEKMQKQIAQLLGKKRKKKRFKKWKNIDNDKEEKSKEMKKEDEKKEKNVKKPKSCQLKKKGV